MLISENVILTDVGHCRRWAAAEKLRIVEETRYDGESISAIAPGNVCSDRLEFACWNEDLIRAAFLINANGHEIIALRAVANAGITGSDVRDMLLEAVETRFVSRRAPEGIKVLSDNGSAYTAKETRNFARQLGLKPCFTPVASLQSNDMTEAFVKTLKRDYLLGSGLIKLDPQSDRRQLDHR